MDPGLLLAARPDGVYSCQQQTWIHHTINKTDDIDKDTSDLGFQWLCSLIKPLLR